MYMTKTIPTIQSVFRLLGALIGYTTLSFGCLFIGNYSKGIFIDIALGLLVIVLTYGLFNLGISKAYRSSINKELRWLSLIFLVLGLFMMYEVGFGDKSNDALFLTRALICAGLFFVTAVIMLLISRSPGVWGCILVMCFTILINDFEEVISIISAFKIIMAMLSLKVTVILVPVGFMTLQIMSIRLSASMLVILI